MTKSKSMAQIKQGGAGSRRAAAGGTKHNYHDSNNHN